MILKNIKFIILIGLLFLLSGCSTINKNLNTTYETNNQDNFENLVNKAEKSMRKCFHKPDEWFLHAPTIVLREDYYNPRYSKIKIIYPSIVRTNFWPYPYLNVLYLIKNEQDNKIIVKEVNFIGMYNLKELVLNNMECK